MLDWQSLRKCSAAAPLFHSPDLRVPDVLANGLPSLEPVEQPADPSDPDAWQPVDPTEPTYDIERIVSAEPRGSGWTLQVKWKGFDEITPEPLGRILRDTKGHADIVAEIEQCKADYYLKNPKKVPADEEQDELLEPTRVQPSRPKKTTPYVFQVYEEFGLIDPPTRSAMICQEFSRVRRESHRRTSCLKELGSNSLTQWVTM